MTLRPLDVSEPVVSMYALIQTAPEKPADVVAAMRALAAVVTARAVRGPYDVIAEVHGSDTAALWDVDGVERVVACYTTPSRVDDLTSVADVA